MGNVINKFNVDEYPFHDIVAKLFEVDDLSGVHLLDLELTKQKLWFKRMKQKHFFTKHFTRS